MFLLWNHNISDFFFPKGLLTSWQFTETCFPCAVLKSPMSLKEKQLSEIYRTHQDLSIVKTNHLKNALRVHLLSLLWTVFFLIIVICKVTKDSLAIEQKTEWDEKLSRSSTEAFQKQTSTHSRAVKIQLYFCATITQLYFCATVCICIFYSMSSKA